MIKVDIKHRKLVLLHFLGYFLESISLVLSTLRRSGNFDRGAMSVDFIRKSC